MALGGCQSSREVKESDELIRSLVEGRLRGSRYGVIDISGGGDRACRADHGRGRGRRSSRGSRNRTGDLRSGNDDVLNGKSWGVDDWLDLVLRAIN